MNENIRKLCAGGIFCLWGTVTLFAQDTAHTNLELDYETDNRTVAIREATYQSDKTRTIKGVILDAKTQEPLIYKPQNKMFHFCKTFCSKITLVNTIQNVI